MEFIFLVGALLVLAVVLGIIIAACQSNLAKKVDQQLGENGFTITRRAGALRVDDKNKKWCINDSQHQPTIYDFSEIVDSVIDEVGTANIIKKLGVYIYTLNGGALYISLINTDTKRDSFICKTDSNIAQQIVSLAKSMIVHSEEQPLDLQQVSPSEKSLSTDDIEEQLKKFKGMVDNGIITQEDYDAKKKQLLGI